MATPSQNLNGVFWREKTYEIGSNVDQYSLYKIWQEHNPENQGDYLGIIEYWSQMQQTAAPLYTMANFGGKNLRTVNDPMGRYTWDVPIINDLPHITRDIDPSNTTKGKGGQPFQLAFNRKVFAYTDVISYDKMSGAEIRVQDTEIINLGTNEYIYTVRLMNNDNTAFLSNDFLKPQTPFFLKYSVKSPEYGERYSQVQTRAGYRSYYNFVGGGQENCSYSISNRAQAMMKANGTKTNGIPMVELWQLHESDQRDPSIVSIPDAAARLGQAGMAKAMSEGWITMSLVTSIQHAAITKMVKGVENNLMWGLGGATTADGPDKIRMTTGLWKQMDNAFKTVYNIGTFTPSILENQIYNFFRGRVDLIGPDPQRKLVVQTGTAGMRQMNEAIKNMAINSGLVINATEVGAISGMKTKEGPLMQTGMDLDFGYAYTSYTIPFLANVKFVVNPALDPILANDIENPIVNGYRTSSYVYIIWDITDNPQDNIFLMKRASDEDDFQWRYINGTCDYMGNTKGFQSSGNFSGYQVYMTMDHKSLQVIDNSKLLKIVPYNVRTGRPFGG